MNQKGRIKMAIDKPLATVECAWCGEDLLVQIPTEETTEAPYIDCVHCGRSLRIHNKGGIRWYHIPPWYSTRVTQNTRISVHD